MEDIIKISSQYSIQQQKGGERLPRQHITSPETMKYVQEAGICKKKKKPKKTNKYFFKRPYYRKLRGQAIEKNSNYRINCKVKFIESKKKLKRRWPFSSILKSFHSISLMFWWHFGAIWFIKSLHFGLFTPYFSLMH